MLIRINGCPYFLANIEDAGLTPAKHTMDVNHRLKILKIH
jgi:hypothetical protein